MRGDQVEQILSPTPTGGNIGIGFAIPANMARNVMTQLIDHGTVRRGMIGVTIQPVTADIARSLGLSEVRGALVNSVNAGGPAEKAGIRQGDVLTAINGQPVKDSNTLPQRRGADGARHQREGDAPARRQGGKRRRDALPSCSGRRRAARMTARQTRTAAATA